MTGDRVVIVGGGHASVRFCEEMRGHGFAGQLILISEEARRPYERPPLSKAVLKGEATPDDHMLLTPDQQAALAIDFHGGCPAERIDRAARQLIMADGLTVPYDILVLATGVAPRRLDCPGSSLPGVFQLGNADQALQLNALLAKNLRSVVIIGGGFIGLEVAASARELGHAVTVVEGAARCAGRLFPPSLSQQLTELHSRKGVNIRTSASVAEILGDARAVAVRLDSDDVLPADLIIVGIGSSPRTALAETSGLAVGNGIVVDRFGRTNDPSIYAIGDVAAMRLDGDATPQRRESWDNAQATAQRAAASIMGAPCPDPAPPWFWTDQYDCNIQLIGEVTGDCDTEIVDRDNGSGIIVYGRADRLEAVALINAGRERRRMMKAVSNQESMAEVASALRGQHLKLAS